MRERVVVITGASAGVGRATAREFGRRGARVALLARGVDGLAAAAQEVEALGGTSLAVVCDVSDDAQVEAAAERAESVLGPIDVWVNNAMVSVFAPIEETTAAEVRRVTEVTYLGTVHGTMAALRRMRPRDAGVIVQVGSALAYRSIPLQAAYCAAKHAVVGFTDSLRSELIRAGSRIAVTAVHLPAINTPQFGWVRTRLPRRPQPVPPIFQPEVAARMIEWASRHPRREVLVGVPTVKAVLGQKFVAGWLDGYLSRAAWDGQMTDEPLAPGRPDNLDAPLPGDHGAHGAFDHRARPESGYAWFTRWRRPILAAAGAAGALALASWASRARRRHGA